MAKKLGEGRKPAGTAGNGRPLNTGDNGMAPEERAKAEEANKKLRYISGIQALRALAPKEAAARAALKEITDQQNGVFLDLKKDGHDKKDVKADLVDVGAVRRNVDAKEIERAKRREWLGLPVGKTGEQLELEARLPEVERNAQHWKAAGFTAAVTGGDKTPPKECQAEGFIDAWTEGVNDGIASDAKGFVAKNSKPKPAPEKPADPEPGTPEAAKAERDAIKNAKASLDAMKPVENEGGTITAADVAQVVGEVFDEAKAVINGEAKPKDADDADKVDDFEAPAEEIAQQSTRVAIQDAKAGATTGETEEAV